MILENAYWLVGNILENKRFSFFLKDFHALTLIKKKLFLLFITLNDIPKNIITFLFTIFYYAFIPGRGWECDISIKIWEFIL